MTGKVLFDVIGSQDLRYRYDAQFCNISHRNKLVRYTDLCFDCINLFGCVGLKRSKYCILNKQYGKEEYETLACDFYPLGKEEVLKKGWKWRD